VADTKISALGAASLPLDGTEVFPIVQGGISEKITALQMGLNRVARLSADQSNSTVTPTKVTGLDVTTGTGTFAFKYYIYYQAAAATTGVRFDVNHSGTVAPFLWNQYWVDVSATAATAAADQDEVLATGAVVGAFASRAKGTAGRGTTLSVDTLNADMLMVIEGLFICTVSGDLQLYHGSEVAAASTVKAGSSLILTRTA
jgi:hypothetical protein